MGRSHPGHWGKWEGAAHEGTQAEDLPLPLPGVAATQGWVSCVGLRAVPGAMGTKEVLSRRVTYLLVWWDQKGLGLLPEV